MPTEDTTLDDAPSKVGKKSTQTDLFNNLHQNGWSSISPRRAAGECFLARLAAYISLEICSRSLNTSLAPQLADSGPLVEDWTFDSLRIRCGALPSFKTDRAAGENKDMTKWIEKYLGVGEWVMDQSVAIAGSSGWFERRR
ncbi:hypothetical protein Landi51_04997 [Colletotrichum acutatum]